MYYHCIIMFSDYEKGLRRAYYKSVKEVKELKEFRSDVKELKGDFKNIKFSFHQIITDSQEIKSVEIYDPYFKGVSFYKDKQKFINKIIGSSKITPSDILKYILVKKPCSKLKAMKLIYFVYEEYLKMTDKYLFEEEFLAWELGPVPKSAYDKLHSYYREVIDIKDKEEEMIKINLKLDRIEEKETILKAIDLVFEKYGEYSPRRLVDITHEKGKPWQKVKDTKGLGSLIPRLVIKECL